MFISLTTCGGSSKLAFILTQALLFVQVNYSLGAHVHTGYGTISIDIQE